MCINILHEHMESSDIGALFYIQYSSHGFFLLLDFVVHCYNAKNIWRATFFFFSSQCSLVVYFIILLLYVLIEMDCTPLIWRLESGCADMHLKLNV